MGARIEGAGSDVIRIEGVASLGGASHEVMPDRIECGTYLAATVAAGGRVRLTGTAPQTLDATLEKLVEAGAQNPAGRPPRANETGRRAQPGSGRPAPFPRLAPPPPGRFL